MIENSIVYRDFKRKYEYFPLSRAEGSFKPFQSSQENEHVNKLVNRFHGSFRLLAHRLSFE